MDSQVSKNIAITTIEFHDFGRDCHSVLEETSCALELGARINMNLRQKSEKIPRSGIYRIAARKLTPADDYGYIETYILIRDNID